MKTIHKILKNKDKIMVASSDININKNRKVIAVRVKHSDVIITVLPLLKKSVTVEFQ